VKRRKVFSWSWNEEIDDAETTLSGSAFQFVVAVIIGIANVPYLAVM